MITVELNIDSKSMEAINMVHLVAETSPDLLLEFRDGILEALESREAVACDFDRLPATAADTLTGTLKLGDQFISRVAALRTLYRQRGFVVPCSLDERHIDFPVRV